VITQFERHWFEQITLNILRMELIMEIGEAYLAIINVDTYQFIF